MAISRLILDLKSSKSYENQITHIEESGRGAGLFSMKERTRLMGGRCSIDSQIGKGTKVNVLVPLNEGNTDAKDKSPGS